MVNLQVLTIYLRSPSKIWSYVTHSVDPIAMLTNTSNQ